MEHIRLLLTNTNSDKEGNIGDHLPQHVPEVPFTAAVAVLHQLRTPQNCTEEVPSFACDIMETAYTSDASDINNVKCE